MAFSPETEGEEELSYSLSQILKPLQPKYTQRDFQSQWTDTGTQTLNHDYPQLSQVFQSGESAKQNKPY